MSDEMGTFRIAVEIENPALPGRRQRVESVLVDTGAELSWFPAPVLELLGARTLEGLNVRIEPTTKQLVDAGPAPAAVVA